MLLEQQSIVKAIILKTNSLNPLLFYWFLFLFISFNSTDIDCKRKKLKIFIWKNDDYKIIKNIYIACNCNPIGSINQQCNDFKGKCVHDDSIKNNINNNGTFSCLRNRCRFGAICQSNGSCTCNFNCKSIHHNNNNHRHQQQQQSIWLVDQFVIIVVI